MISCNIDNVALWDTLCIVLRHSLRSLKSCASCARIILRLLYVLLLQKIIYKLIYFAFNG